MAKVPHQFQSITEQQWKSGVSRHHCAECSRDYDDPVHVYHYVPVSQWPVIIEDYYVSKYATQIVKLTEDYGIETAYATVHALAVYAELGLRGAVLN